MGIFIAIYCQSYLVFIQGIHIFFLSAGICVFPGNQTHNVPGVNALIATCTGNDAFSPGLWSGQSLALGTSDRCLCSEIWAVEMGRRVICTLASSSKRAKSLYCDRTE